MKVIKENIADLLGICLGLGLVILALTFLDAPNTLPPGPATNLFVGALIIGIFLHRLVSGSQGEPLTSLPRVGIYELRYAGSHEGDREKGEEPYHEFIVVINGESRLLVLPKKSVWESGTGNPRRLVHQIFVGEPEYVLETEKVTGYSLVGRQ